MSTIKENIEKVNAQKEAAAVKAGRKGEDILLVGVTKTRTPEEINAGIDAGLTDICLLYTSFGIRKMPEADKWKCGYTADRRNRPV